MNIYFAGSITGGREDSQWYQTLIEHLKQYGTVLTEHIGQQKLSAAGESEQSAEYVYTRDREWIEQADIIVAEVTMPSLGVGYELGFAESLGKKILCLFRTTTPRTLSRMISGNGYNTVLHYDSDNQAMMAIDTYFSNMES